jgi:hypothetical protein
MRKHPRARAGAVLLRVRRLTPDAPAPSRARATSLPCPSSCNQEIDAACVPSSARPSAAGAEISIVIERPPLPRGGTVGQRPE